MANGVTKFGLWVQRQMHAHDHHTCLQTDISNAFGGLHRQQVLAGFQEVSHDLADLVGAWVLEDVPLLQLPEEFDEVEVVLEVGPAICQ